MKCLLLRSYTQKKKTAVMHFTSLCTILSETLFADLDIPCSKQLRETRADKPTKMLPLRWQYNRNQKVPGSPTAAMSADYVSCRHVCVALFGSSANGLCEPSAPSHALIYTAAADTFVELTSPSPQDANKERSEML